MLDFPMLILHGTLVLSTAILMSVFFEKRKTPLWVAILSYVYFFISPFLMFELTSLPGLFILTMNISTFALLTLNYESSKIKKIIAFFCAVSFFFTLDLVALSIIMVLTPLGERGNPYDTTPDAVGVIILTVLSLSLVLLYRRFKNIKRDIIPFPMGRVYALFIVISLTFYLVTLSFTMEMPRFVIVMSALMMIALNTFAYYLHHVLSAAYDSNLKEALYAQEKEYYLTQSLLMQESVEKVRAIRHDMKSHLTTVRDYSADNKEVTDYLNRLLGDIGESEAYSSTGNIAIDSIINYKLRDVEGTGVSLDVKVAVPPDLQVDAADIITILGNLLDNALEAVAKVPDNKMLKLNVKYDSSGVLIRVENSFNGEIKYLSAKAGEEKQITTLKAGEGHGYGLKNVRQAVEKYNGYVKITYTEDVFSAMVFLYIY